MRFRLGWRPQNILLWHQRALDRGLGCDVRGLLSLRHRVRSGRRRSFALAACSLLLGRWVRVRSFRARETSASVLTVVVYSLHVVKQVVPPREAVARESTLAASVEAEVRSVTVTVHTMGLSLVTEQAGGGREFLFGASLLSAAEWLEMRINELAVRALWSETQLHNVEGGDSNVLTRSCT